jgi:hypothetical protein
MKGSTDHRKLPGKIVRLLRSERGSLSRIARSVRLPNRRRGVSRSLVAEVLDGLKESRRARRAILREAIRIEKARCFQSAGRIEDPARRFEI